MKLPGAVSMRGAMLSRSRHTPRSRGQALAEFAIVVPVLLAIIGAIIQFGMIFWAQNTLTQVVRDTGRWEATQQTTCWDSAAWGAAQTSLRTEANAIAANSSLLGYTTGMWTIQNYPATTQPTEGVEAAWFQDQDPPVGKTKTEGCPPTDNQAVYHVTIRISHTVPVFLPGMQYLPGFGTCGGSPCVVLSSTAQFRMEPAPAP
jgi:Flp pilus assembly protein TadG